MFDVVDNNMKRREERRERELRSGELKRLQVTPKVEAAGILFMKENTVCIVFEYTMIA